MTRSTLVPALLIAACVLVTLTAACGGGGGDKQVRAGNLTDPRDVPTATPWPSPPDLIIIDPSALPTLPAAAPGAAGGSPAASSPTPTPAPAGQAGVCGDTYTVAGGDSPSSIATKCGITTQGILDANPGLDAHNMHPGDTIKLPKPSP